MFITNSHKKSLIAQEQVLGTLFTTPLYTSTTSNMVVPDEVLEKAAKYDAINTPEITDFIKAVENEALHQRERWGSDNDAGKTDADWFWLIGYLAGKAINKPEKMLHHIITTAAACLNWHSARTGNWGGMRPGIDNTIYTAESKENEK